jgi:alkylation response protein AidB-like acyl-CoA dehydrogenase
MDEARGRTATALSGHKTVSESQRSPAYISGARDGGRLMRFSRYDQGHATGEYANAAKYLCAEAAFEACERAVMVHGGMGYAKEYHVERYFREAMLPRLAPISREMIFNYIAERVLALPRSY